ncbi:MAG: DUF559 domain-containing protein [Syntrophobacteraceae bacterium]|nr:DUF559 domain-containing protein [Syntrophobacteraceae bacterium]
MKQTARELRRSQIEAERVFWNHVRGRRLSGLSFAGSTPLDRLSSILFVSIVASSWSWMAGSTLKTSKRTKSDRFSWETGVQDPEILE